MKLELEPNIKKRTIKAFLDLTILCRLMRKPMSGYGINALLAREFGISVSPDTIYHTLYSMERKGLLQCVRNKPGRVYSLTENGLRIAETVPDKVKEIQVFLEKLLYN